MWTQKRVSLYNIKVSQKLNMKLRVSTSSLKIKEKKIEIK